MSLKEILVHLDTTPRSAARLTVAADLAALHGAHLVGLGIADLPSTDQFRGNIMALLPGSPQQAIENMRREATAGLAPVEAMFSERLRDAGLVGEWRLAEGNPAAIMALQTRYADLAIMGQPNRYEAHDSAEDAMLESALMHSGRPILVVPFAGEFATVGQRVLVAWNASREAARALHDALPLLCSAELVTVLAINPQSSPAELGGVAAADIAAHLARHGVRVEATHTVAADITDGAALLSYAADIGVDLIVAGAYGHSRMREMVFGGVTRTLLAEMTAPVFLSH
jgi:nucleotide-binding universal stress UspA family protein